MEREERGLEVKEVYIGETICTTERDKRKEKSQLMMEHLDPRGRKHANRSTGHRGKKLGREGVGSRS